METSRIKKMIPYICILLVSVFFYEQSSRIEFIRRRGNLGPDFWPKAVLVLMMLACLYEIAWIGFFSKDRAPGKATEAPKKEKEEAAPEQFTHLLIIGTGLTMVYAYFIDIGGFIVSTFLYLALFMYVGRYRKIGVILSNSVLGTLVLAFVFIKLVYISLPAGRGPFAAVSYFVLGLMGVK